MLAVNAHLMLAVNAHLTLAVIPILYIGSAKVQQNSNFTKRKSDFFSSPLTLFLLYSFFIPSLFLLYSFFIPDSRAAIYFFGTKVSQV